MVESNAPAAGLVESNAPAVMVRDVALVMVECRRLHVAAVMVESNAPAAGLSRISPPATWSRSSPTPRDVAVMVESNAAGDVAVDGDPLVTAPATW